MTNLQIEKTKRKGRLLGFKDQTIEASYLSYWSNKRIHLNRFSLGLALLMYSVFLLPDYLFEVPYIGLQVLFRLVLMPLALILVFLSTWLPLYRNQGEKLILIPLSMGSGLHLPMAIFNGSAYPSSFFVLALGLMTLYNFLFSGIRFRFALLSGSIIFIQFLLTELFLIPHPVNITVLNIFFMTSILVLGILSNYVIEDFSRKDFIFNLEKEQFIDDINQQKQRSENLLENILPKKIANELKDRGNVIPKEIADVTVMFIDIVGFTKLTAEVPADKLVGGLHLFFSAVDEIVSKHGLEKLKTIGDGYLCAGGIPNGSPTHAIDCCNAALDVVDFVQSQDSSAFPIQVRIGINTGNVMAGVVGTKKFSYDIWGNAVNMAFRMEQHSMPNRINISESTLQFVKDFFSCSERGKLPVKGKGMNSMFFLDSQKISTPPKAI